MTLKRYLTAVVAGSVASLTVLTTPTSAASGPQSIRSAVMKLTNTERKKAGCLPLKERPALNEAAQRHSRDMARHHFVGHIGSNGSTMVKRAEAAGYTGWRALAENVAGGQTSAKGVVKGWMKSPGHRANMLNCLLTHMGVGHMKGSGSTYWTQNFGAKSRASSR